MKWVDLIWSVSTSVCLSLALLQFFVRCRGRETTVNLLFVVVAVSTVLFGLGELAMMRAETPEQYGTILKWAQLAAWPLIMAFAGFLHLYLQAGSRWLVFSICGLRTLSVILNFATGVNLNFLTITHLRKAAFLGETVSVAEGVRNPWMLVGQASLLLLMVLAVQATTTTWRRGERRRALTVGGSAVFFMAVGVGHTVMVLWGVLPGPLMGSLTFLAMVAAMGLELSGDVVRSEQLAQDLGERELELSLAAESASLGIWVRDLVRSDIRASQVWRRLFGFTREERIELETALAKVHPADRETVRQALEKCADYDIEYRLPGPDGRIRWISSRGRVEVDATGQPVCIRGVSMDVTRRRQNELEIHKQRQELAHLARVTMLGELSGSMAHELNQPLTAILSNAQAARRFLAHDKVDLKELGEILSDIVAESRRASEVLVGLRRLLQKGEVKMQPLSANDLVHDVIKLIRAELANQSVDIHAQLAATLPTISGDRVQIQQVLLNLLMNASDAMNKSPAADRRLLVCTAQCPKGVHFSVSDNGPGISPEALDKMFEPFFTTKGHGLGLGLSVCRTILLAHGGELWANNNEQGGPRCISRCPRLRSRIFEQRRPNRFCGRR